MRTSYFSPDAIRRLRHHRPLPASPTCIPLTTFTTVTQASFRLTDHCSVVPPPTPVEFVVACVLARGGSPG